VFCLAICNFRFPEDCKRHEKQGEKAGLFSELIANQQTKKLLPYKSFWARKSE
jgi:hypothetical protein